MNNMTTARIENALKKQIRGINRLYITKRTLESLENYMQGTDRMVVIHSRAYIATIIEEGEVEHFAKTSDTIDIYPAPPIPVVKSVELQTAKEIWEKSEGLDDSRISLNFEPEGEATRKDPLVPKTKRKQKSAPDKLGPEGLEITKLDSKVPGAGDQIVDNSPPLNQP